MTYSKPTLLLITNPLTAKEVSQWSGAPRILWFYNAPHNPEVADLLDGRINDLLKAEAQYQLGDTTWWYWGPVLKNAVSHDGAARIHGSRHQGRVVKHLWLLHPMTLLSKCLLPFSVTLNQILFGFKQQEWLLLPATEAWLVCILNQHPSGRVLSICLFFFF